MLDMEALTEQVVNLFYLCNQEAVIPKTYYTLKIILFLHSHVNLQLLVEIDASCNLITKIVNAFSFLIAV